MPSIELVNIGPIKRPVKIVLNKINVFIGPQGSGKSTIAKLASFCLWLEKDCVKRQMISHVDKEFINRNLTRYHNMEGYLSDDSRFSFHGDAIDMEWNGKNFALTCKESFASAPLTKMAYIPAERSVVSIPGIFSTKMPDNYIRDFIEDWLSIRQYYAYNGASDDTDGKKVELLDLGQYYTFNPDTQMDEITGMDHDKPFALSQVSSGMQAVTPICVMVDYLTDWIYHHQENRSAEDMLAMKRAALARVLATESNIPNFYDRVSKDKELSDLFDRFVKNYSLSEQVGNDKVTETEDSTLADVKAMEGKYRQPALSNIIIEEPELNLFPTSQVEMINYLMKSVNNDRDSLMITTHSPYMLYALNNCMLASRAAESEDAELMESVTVIPRGAWIDPAKVSVWEMGDGGIRGDKTIQDECGLIRDNYFDNVMHNVMADFRNLLSFSADNSDGCTKL